MITGVLQAMTPARFRKRRRSVADESASDSRDVVAPPSMVSKVWEKR